MRQPRRQDPEPKTQNPEPALPEPLTEGPAPARRPPGFYSRMGDEELTGFAAGIPKERRIPSKAELRKKDFGLYTILRRRGLLNEIAYGRESVCPGPSTMDRGPRARPAKDSAGETGIEAQKGLQEADSGKRGAMIGQTAAPEAASPEKEPKMSILEGIRGALGVYKRKE